MLPIAMQIAARTENLDNIRVEPVNYYTGIRKRIYTLHVPCWEKKLIDKSIESINNDITKSLEINREAVFYVYALAGYGFRSKFFVLKSIDLMYEIR